MLMTPSIYAATKKSNELMARSYNNLFGLKCTGLRFFTVYGPWGRPDMAYFIFTKRILKIKLSIYLITEKCIETLHTLMILFMALNLP